MIPPLFLVTDRALVPDLPAAVARALHLLPLRSCAVVLREKDLPVRDLVALARALREETWRRKAKLLVSGRFDVALACGADGVHLGGEAPDASAVRAIVPAGFLVGVSVHGSQVPETTADYCFRSPVFATASKPGAAPLGLAGLRAGLGPVPTVALGGIDASNAADCFAAGAAAVALRSGWTALDEASAAVLARVVAGART